MHFNNETEMNQRTINLSTGKNCSTSSTDSGVILIDNAATFRTSAEATTKDNSSSGSASEGEESKAKPQRISIEQTHTVNISQDKATRQSNKASPALSIRSTTISIVSIDDNAIDSSCIDSDSEADADYTVQKLGQQITYPPNSADLNQLHQGLTVIGRQVGQGELPPLPNEAGVVAKQLLNNQLNVATTAASASQDIGRIAVNNSTDVTFGDKHFYEGPVTIQQFLIDNRDKWKPVDGETGGQDNPGFNGQTTANGSAAGAKLNDPTQPPLLCPYMPSTISRKAITLTVIFVLLTSILGVVLATTTNIFGKTLNKTNLDVIDNGTLVLMNVTDWGGKPPRKELDPLNLPVQRVIISHTAAEDCESKDLCSDRVRVVQFFHRDGWGWDDIGYNFLIGGDGRVYVGRGWDKQGAHTKGYNTNGIGISFIGTFTTIKPPERQLKACQLLLEEGVRLKKLMPDFRLYGHRQLSATESPGEQLYKIIQTWPHWSHQI